MAYQKPISKYLNSMLKVNNLLELLFSTISFPFLSQIKFHEIQLFNHMKYNFMINSKIKKLKNLILI